MNATVLILGLGHLGGVILELLAREPGIGRIVAAGRDADRGRARVNVARLGASAQGRTPVLEFEPADARDPHALAPLVDRLRPDIVLTTVTMQSWWVSGLLPEAARAALGRARFGAWLPVHLAPTLDVMRALKDAGYRGVTLTAPFPDAVNRVLGCVGLAPTCGIGNLDELEPKVRLLAAERLGVPPSRVTVTLVAHHALEPFVFGAATGEPPPSFVRIACDGRDVTAEVGGPDLLRAPYRLPSTPAWHFLTAATVVRLVRALGSDRPVRLHAPGPEGLPGGYPVLASRDGVRVAPVEGLTLADAIAMNERAQQWDGIARIEPDGTVVICDDDAGVLRDVLGYDGARIVAAEAGALGLELVTRFREFARRAGVDLDRARWSGSG